MKRIIFGDLLNLVKAMITTNNGLKKKTYPSTSTPVNKMFLCIIMY